MTTRLSRRALFALPVAAVAAPMLATVRPYATGGVAGPLRVARIIGESGPEAVMPLEVHISMDPDFHRLLRVEAQRAVERDWRPAGAIKTFSKMHPGEGAAAATKPVTAQAAAPMGERSCGGRGVEASAHDNPAPHGLAPTVGAGHDQQTQVIADRRDRSAPDVGNVAEPEAARESALRSPPPHDALPTIEAVNKRIRWHLDQIGALRLHRTSLRRATIRAAAKGARSVDTARGA